MKKLSYKTPGLILLGLLFGLGSLTAQEVTKEFHKEYPAGANTTLEISNRYGDVVIESWDKDQVVINVKVTIEMPSRDRAERMLGYIDVQFSEEGNNISAKTIIDDKFNFTGWSSDNRKFSIDYDVKMPVKAALTLSNKYGNTDINELGGLTNLDIKYGNITAGKLTRGNVKPLNKLNLAYGKGTITEAGWIDATIRYSGRFEISKSQAILLDSKYSKLSLGETSSMVGASKYDNIRIESINNMVIEDGYSEINIGTLKKKLNFTGSYGSLTVETIPAGFESVDVETRYMGVKLGIDESASYKLDAKVSYGGLKYSQDNFRNQRRNIENNKQELSGIVGKTESPSASVNVVASYGTVRLN